MCLKKISMKNYKEIRDHKNGQASRNKMLLLEMKTIIIKIRNLIIKLIIILDRAEEEPVNHKINLSNHEQQRESIIDI